MEATYYFCREPGEAERAFGEAVAAFVAAAFDLPALRLLWVTPGDEVIEAIDRVLGQLESLSGNAPEPKGFRVDGDIAGLSRRELADLAEPAIVIRTGLAPDLLIETIGHEGAHVLQHREFGATLTPATLETWEDWASRFGKATVRAWWRTVGLDDPRFDLFLRYYDERKGAAR